MKVKSLAVISALGGPLLIGHAADAAYTGLTTTVNQVTIGGFGNADVIRVYASFDSATDVLSNVYGNAVFPLFVATGDGSDLFQHAFGADSGMGQSPATIAMFPDVAYDSFLDIGMTLNTQGAPVFFSPGFPPAGWGAGGTVSTTNGSWTRFPGDPLSVAGADGSIFIGQFTVARGTSLSGSMNLTTSSGGLPGIQLGQTFNVVPAPGALALLGVAGLVRGRRRRRA